MISRLEDWGGRFLIIVLVGRALGPVGLGQYSFVVIFTSMFMFLCVFGLERYVIREAARAPERAGELLGNVLRLTAILSLPSIVIQLAVVWAKDYPVDVRHAVALAAVTAILGGVVSLLTAIFFAAERMEYETFYLLIERTATLAVLIPLILARGNIVQIFAVLLATRVVGLAACLWFLYRKLGQRIILGPWRATYSLFAIGWPFALNTVATAVYTRADVVLLSFYRSDAEVGIYRAGSVLIAYLPALALALNNAIMPAMSRDGRADPARFLRTLGRSIQWLSAIAFPLAVGIPILAPKVIPLLFGQGFVQAGMVLRMLAVVIVFRFLSNALGTALTAQDRQRRRAYSVFAGAAANLLFNILLIPRWGYWGAIVSCISSEVLIFVFLAASIRLAGVRTPWAALTYRAALATAVMSALLYPLRGANLAVSAITAFAVYAAAAFLLQVVPRADQRAILQLTLGRGDRPR